MPQRPEIKAHGWVESINAMRAVSTEDRWQKLVAALTPECRQLVLSPPLPIAWIPLEVVQHMLPLAVELLYDGDATRLTEAGKRQIQNDLNGLYKMFIRIATPAYASSRAAKMYETYSRGCGTMSSQLIAEKRVEVAVVGRPFAQSAYWHYLMGSITGVLELTGVKDVRTEITRGGTTDPDCTFIASWT